MIIDTKNLIARLQANSIENGGTLIIPNAVYELIQEEADYQMETEAKGRAEQELAEIESHDCDTVNGQHCTHCFRASQLKNLINA